MTKRSLYVMSVIYLGCSTFFFEMFWLKLNLAIPFCGLFLISIYLIIKQINEDETLKKVIPHKSLIYLFCLSFLLVISSGAGGFGFQNFDYQFHNAKFYDLFAAKLPSYYPQIDNYPCYYFGYYLPVSLAAKPFGVQSLAFLSLFWTFFGFYLGLIWLYLLANQQLKVVFLFFLCGGTLSSVIVFFLDFSNILTSGNKPFSGSFLQYISFVEHLHWVPNQVIPCIITIGAVVHDIYIEKKLYRPYFLALSSVFWGPFPAVGICLIFAFLVIRHWFLSKKFFYQLKNSLLYLIITTVAFVPVILYLAANNGGQIFGFIAHFETNWLSSWVIFVFLNVLVIYFLVPKKEILLKPILQFSLFVLALIPSWKIGLNNDFCVRVSMPFLFVLYLCFANGIFKIQSRFKRSLAVLVLFIGMIIPLKFIGRGLYYLPTSILQSVNYAKFKNTYSGLIWGYGQVGADEYLCKKDSYFYKNMLRK